MDRTRTRKSGENEKWGGSIALRVKFCSVRCLAVHGNIFGLHLAQCVLVFACYYFYHHLPIMVSSSFTELFSFFFPCQGGKWAMARRAGKGGHSQVGEGI